MGEIRIFKCVWLIFYTFVSQKSFIEEKNTVNIWGKVFKNEQSKICGRQFLKNLKECGLFLHPLKTWENFWFYDIFR